jgi:hypothetical protein
MYIKMYQCTNSHYLKLGIAKNPRSPTEGSKDCALRTVRHPQ